MCYVNYSNHSNSPSFLSSSYWITAICLIADSNTSNFLIKNSLSSICSHIYYRYNMTFFSFTRFTKFFRLALLITTLFTSILYIVLLLILVFLLSCSKIHYLPLVCISFFSILLLYHIAFFNIQDIY